MGYRLKGLSHDTLPRMQHLTSLDLHELSVENLLQLGALTGLRELHLTAARDIAVGPSSVPGLVFPALLQKLMLASPIEAGVFPLIPAELRHLNISSAVQGPAEGPDSFLSCMARMQHLTRLELP